MSEETIDTSERRARICAASPLPWFYDRYLIESANSDIASVVHEPHGQLLVAAINDYPALLDAYDELAALRDENARLKKEHASLRNTVEKLQNEVFDWKGKHVRKSLDCIELRAENAKLREVVREIYRGKIASDNGHPLGEYGAMVIRFRNLARAALAAPEREKQP